MNETRSHQYEGNALEQQRCRDQQADAGRNKEPALKKQRHKPEQILGLRSQVHHSIFHGAADVPESAGGKLGGGLKISE